MFDANDTPVKQKNDHTSESQQIKVVWIKWVMGHQYLLESNYSCLWKHVENNLFLSNFMKLSMIIFIKVYFHLKITKLFATLKLLNEIFILSKQMNP
jgi:hypothetical protein